MKTFVVLLAEYMDVICSSQFVVMKTRHVFVVVFFFFAVKSG